MARDKDKKGMKLSNTSPLSQLLNDKTIKGGGPLGREEDRIPFVELLEEGWTVKAPSYPMNKNFGGIMRENMTMIVPTDESMQSAITRIHEMLHVALTPKVGLTELADTDQVPPEVINAFEDGRINAIGHREVERFRKMIDRRGLPIDVEMLQDAVKDTVDRRIAWQAARDEHTHSQFFAFLEDDEIRMTGACMMAASEMYSHKHEAEWQSIGRACLMDDEQLAHVTKVCHGLGEMTYEQMIEAMKDMAEFLMHPKGEEDPTGGGASSKGDREGFDDKVKPTPGEGDDDGEEGETEGDGGEDGDADGDDGDDADGDPGDGEPDTGLTSGMGEGKGRDYTPEQAGSNLRFQTREGATVPKVELPKPTRMGSTPMQRVGQRVATFDATKTKASNKHTYADRFGANVAGDRWKAPAYAYEQIGREVENERIVVAQEAKQEAAYGKKPQITDEHYGVTVAEEEAVARRYARAGYDINDEYKKPPMTVLEYPLTETVIAPMGNERKARKHDRVGYMTTPSRAHIDGKVFRRKMRVRRLEPAGAILLDCSGSMHPSSELIRKCLEIAPYAVVGGYAGNDSGRGSFTVLARNRKCVSEKQLGEILREMGGGNSVDFPALEWLATQPGPRVWVSDAGICGSGTNELKNVHLCFQICREYDIRRVLKLEMLLGLQPLVNNMQAAVNAARVIDASRKREEEGGS